MSFQFSVGASDRKRATEARNKLAFPIIDPIIDEIESLPDKKAAALSELFTKSQPDIVAFFFASTTDCSEGAVETGFFITLILWKYFSRTQRLGLVREKSILIHHDKTQERLQAAEKGTPGALEKLLEPEKVMADEAKRFMVTAVVAAHEEEEIEEQDIMILFATLIVIANSFSESTAKRLGPKLDRTP